MTVSSQRRARSAAQKKASVGLAAIGASGSWEVSIDQTTSGPERWFMQIEGPSAYFHFEIPSLEIIDSTIRFLADLRGHAPNDVSRFAKDGILPIGASKASQVRLVRDDEFNDRCFLVMEFQRAQQMRFTLTGDDVTHVMASLRQLKDDLPDSAAPRDSRSTKTRVGA